MLIIADSVHQLIFKLPVIVASIFKVLLPSPEV